MISDLDGYYPSIWMGITHPFGWVLPIQSDVIQSHPPMHSTLRHSYSPDGAADCRLRGQSVAGRQCRGMEGGTPGDGPAQAEAARQGSPG